jgi:uncharacterized protein with gpF-like domain
MKEANAKLKAVTQGHIRESILIGLKMGMVQTGSTLDFNLYEPNIIRAVEQRSGFFVDRTNESTAKSLSDTLSDGIKAGESIEDLSRRVDKIFRFSENYRAKRIAQTEVIGATNDGQVKAFGEAGFKKKSWSTARDELVRKSHRIDGQVRDLTQSFTTKAGSHLQYPGDRTSGAPAEEVINCRCTVIAED